MQHNVLSKIGSYFIYSLPFFLIIGPALPDIVMVISILLIISEIIYSKNYKYFNNNYFKFFICFYFLLIGSSLLSEFALSSLESSFFYIRFILLPIIIWYLIENNTDFLKYFFISLLCAFIIALLAGLYQFIFTEDIRMYLLGSDNALMGHYLVRIFPLLVGIYIHYFNPRISSYVFLLILFVISDVVIYSSGERTALGLMTISSIFILIFISKFKVLRLSALFFSLIIIIIISIYFPSIKERNIDRSIEQIGLNSSSNQVYIFSKVHHTLYSTSIKIFRDNFVIGIGPNNFRNHCSDKDYTINRLSCSTHPHNTYIQILAETGILGFLFIMIILFYFLYNILIHTKSIIRSERRYLSDFQVCIFACYLLTLFPFLPTLNFFTNWINIIYFLPIGFFLYTIYSEDYKKLNYHKKNL